MVHLTDMGKAMLKTEEGRKTIWNSERQGELRYKCQLVCEFIREFYGVSLEQLDSGRIWYHLNDLMGDVYQEVMEELGPEEREEFWGKLRGEGWHESGGSLWRW